MWGFFNYFFYYISRCKCSIKLVADCFIWQNNKLTANMYAFLYHVYI